MTSPIVRTACRTGQTAVASIPRRVLSGLREMRFCFRLRCLLSHENDLLGDLPVSSLLSSDPARPARLCTSVHMVCEHLRVKLHSRGTLVQRGSVFTPSPSLGNPDAIQLARYYSSILSPPSQSGKETDGKR
jgi:hypothetical protein